MLKTKKARLEARGWRIGSAQEFLGLSDEESAYVELRLRLAESLRLRRQKRKLSQSELAKMIRSSQSRVAKMEGGDPSRLHRPTGSVTSRAGGLESRSGPCHLRWIAGNGELNGPSGRRGPSRENKTLRSSG